MLYTTHVEKVILVSTMPSNLALDAPVNEEKKKFNLIETEQKSHSDTGQSLVNQFRLSYAVLHFQPRPLPLLQAWQPVLQLHF